MGKASDVTAKNGSNREIRLEEHSMTERREKLTREFGSVKLARILCFARPIPLGPYIILSDETVRVQSYINRQCY